MATIRMKRGIQSDIETMPLLSGEMAVALDTGRVFVGTEEGTVPLGTGDMYAAIYDPTKKEQDIFAYAVPAAEKGVAGGVATLDESGKIPKAFLPEYSGGDTATGKKTVRFVIGTATAGWTEADCDYLCDGIDDQVEINAAIQALSDYGGEIKVLDGEYHLTDAIIADKNNLRLCGSGKGTIFKRYYNSSSNDNGLIYFDGSTKRQNHYHQFYENFLIDGNSESYNTGSGLVIKGTYTNPERGSEDISISNVSSYNNSGYGIAVIYAKKVSIIGNVIVNNGMGICVDNTESTVVAGNTVTGGTSYGISLDSTADAAITGNTIVDISSQAIVSYGKRCTVCGNTIINAGRYGVYGYSSKTSAIVGNTIVKEDSYTSSQYSIYLGSSSEKNIVVGNICTGKAPTVEGSGNVIENNLV